MKKLVFLSLAILSAITFVSCSSSDPETTGGSTTNTDKTDTESTDSGSGSLADYTAPTYVDDYTSMAEWTKRSKWNLANVHDPSVMLADDGYYYMYQTDASYGNAHTGKGHFFCRRSKNLVDWEFLGATMKKQPTWLKDKVNEIRKSMGLSESTVDFTDDTQFGYWAPCVRKVSSNLYRMYYSINMPSADDKSTSTAANICPNMMGMMETSTPSDVSSWVDKGFVISQYSDQDLNYSNKSIWGGYYKYNVIDPSFIITPSGEHWLIYGSWHSGFAAVQLDPSTGMPKTALGNPWGTDNEASYGKFIYSRLMNNRWQASEGPEVVYHDGYYYMFVAYDELAVAYNTRVVRSKNIDGPYTDILGTNLTTNGGEAYPIVTHPYKFGTDHGWVGISHCAVFDDGNGNWYYASQQRFPENYNSNPYSNAIMMGGVRSIVWTQEGWPLVLPERYAAVPQTKITESELLGNWQHINLAYSYKKQDVSVNISLESNHTVSSSSAWSAGLTWSFNATSNILTIGSTKLYLKRELDWEASPRKATIVYVGLSADKKTTYWGKKVE